MLKKLANLKVLIPSFLTLVALLFAMSVSNLSVVMASILAIPGPVIGISFGLVIVYLILKAAQFHFLLEELDIRPTWRQKLLALAVGEMALTVPAGDYAQNYVLRRIDGVSFSRSSAATTVMLASVGFVGLVTLAVLGIPGLNWLRPAIVAIYATGAVIVTALLRSARVQEFAARVVQAGPLKKSGRQFVHTVEGLHCLFTPRMVVRASLLTAAYLLSLVGAFFLVAHGVGVFTFTFQQAVTVYLFAITVGFAEASGLGAMKAWGYNASQALSALLGFRLLWTGLIWRVCGFIVLLLRKEMKRSKSRSIVIT